VSNTAPPPLPAGALERQRRYGVRRQLAQLLRQRQQLLRTLHLYRRQCRPGSAEYETYGRLLEQLQAVAAWQV
jgi:hypothetical protein